MGFCTYLAFCLSADAEEELQKTLSDLIHNPARLVFKNGWVLRVWPAEKWDAGRRLFVDFIEDFVTDHEKEALLVKHGESYADGHEQLGVGEGNPFRITVDYPIGYDDPHFSYDDENGQRRNTRHIVREQVACMKDQPDLRMQFEWARYIQYLYGWAKMHNSPKFYGMSPVCFDEWRSCEDADDQEDTE